MLRCWEPCPPLDIPVLYAEVDFWWIIDVFVALLLLASALLLLLWLLGCLCGKLLRCDELWQFVVHIHAYGTLQFRIDWNFLV